MSNTLSTPTRDTAALNAAGLVIRRGGREVISDLSFVLPAGGALVVRGPNGSGKTSLLRVLAGFLPPAGGIVDWLGAPLYADRAAVQSRVHFVGHLDPVKPSLTVAEHLAQWSAILGGGLPDPKALARFGLAALTDTPARYLSAGQRRRLNLCRLALANRPLWLLDEPLVSLDEEGAAQLQDLVSRHRTAGGMVVASTHQSLPFDDVVFLDLGEAPGSGEAK